MKKSTQIAFQRILSREIINVILKFKFFKEMEKTKKLTLLFSTSLTSNLPLLHPDLKNFSGEEENTKQYN